jgi:competence protein ComEC
VFGPAEALNDQTVRMTATVLEWPEEGKFGSCTMAVRAEINGSSIKAVLTLDEEGMTLRPGEQVLDAALALVELLREAQGSPDQQAEP